MNYLISIKEVEFVVLNPPKKKTPDPDNFIREFYQTCNEQITLVPHSPSKRKE
jgi:hypothetical protein